MVREGYKQTEVGVIPEEWEVVKIDALGDVVRGGSPRPAGDPRYFNGSFIPWLTVASLTNIPNHQLEVTQTAGGLTEEGSKRSRKLERRTIIIANSGATLGVAKILGITCCANDGIAAIINKTKGDEIYFCQYFNTITDKLRNVIATGNGQPNLNTTLIKDISIPFPSIEEQQAIAEALSDVDGLIDGLEKLIAKKRDIKTATMQQLLTGKTRLPDFGESKGYKQTELGEIPEDWDLDYLGQFADITKLAGFEYSKHFNSYKDGGDIIVVRGTNITQNTMDVTDVKTIPRTTSNKLPRSKLFKDDLVFAYVGTIGPIYLIEEDERYHLGPNTAKITCKSGMTPHYLLAYFKCELMQTEIDEKISVGAQPSLSMTKIRTFKIIRPQETEQQAIAAVLTDIDNEIVSLQSKLDKTKAIKQGMMQELLTGKTRLI